MQSLNDLRLRAPLFFTQYQKPHYDLDSIPNEGDIETNKSEIRAGVVEPSRLQDQTSAREQNKAHFGSIVLRFEHERDPEKEAVALSLKKIKQKQADLLVNACGAELGVDTYQIVDCRRFFQSQDPFRDLDTVFSDIEQADELKHLVYVRGLDEIFQRDDVDNPEEQDQSSIQEKMVQKKEDDGDSDDDNQALTDLSKNDLYRKFHYSILNYINKLEDIETEGGKSIYVIFSSDSWAAIPQTFRQRVVMRTNLKTEVEMDQNQAEVDSVPKFVPTWGDNKFKKVEKHSEAF